MNTIGVLLLAAATAGDGFGYDAPGVGLKHLFRGHLVSHGAPPPGGMIQAGAPTVRTGHSALWTGDTMLVCGGREANSTARPDTTLAFKLTVTDDGMRVSTFDCSTGFLMDFFVFSAAVSSSSSHITQNVRSL